MPQDFDPDEFMSRRRKPAPQPAQTGDFDPDAFMARRRQPQQPKRLPATINPEFSLTEGLGAPVQPRAKRPRPSAEEELLGYDRFRQEKRRRDEARAEADLLRYDPAGYSEGTPLTPRREAFSRKPYLERKFERAMDEFRGGGLEFSRMARQAAGAIVRRRDPQTGKLSPVDFPAWRQREEERRRNLAERERARPPMSLGEEVGGGIVRAIPTVGAAIGLGTLTGGGALPTMGIGGGLSAAGADWSNPKRAVAETAVGAIAPVIGGKIGQKIGGAVASRLARPAAQRAARVGGELVGGATGNVGGALAMGERRPRELVKSAGIGLGLSAPGAMAAARRPAVAAKTPAAAEMPIAAPESPAAASGLPGGVRVIRVSQGEQIPPRERGQRQIPLDVEQPDGSVETVLVVAPERINGRRVNETTLRPLAEQALKLAAQPGPVTTTGAEPAPPRVQPSEAKGRIVRVGDKDFTLTPEQEAQWKTEIDEPLAQAKLHAADLAQRQGRQEADKYHKGAAMRIAARKREIVGAFTPREQAAREAREATNYRGKPVSVDVGGQRVNATVEGMSFGRVRVKLEDGRQMTADRSQIGAPVGRPAPVPEQVEARTPQPEPTPARGVTGKTPAYYADNLPPARTTAEIPRPTYPDAPETQEMPAIQRRITAENAPTAELPAVAARQPQQPPRPRTERLPVPKATEENIGQLRQRQEELGRLAYDRRGEFPSDLRDEYNQLNAHIRDYDNQRAPQELAPPPGTQPGRMVPPTGELQARRRALDPRTRFSSREDERQGYFERFNDEELIDEIRRMEEQRNQAIRGRSRLTPAEAEANEFDLKIAVEMQKERRRIQAQQGREPIERIAPRTPGRPPRKEETAQPPESVRAVPETAKAVAKEPWQMTRQEFERAADTEWFKGKRWFNKPQQLANARREVVQQAMEDGKSVPPEVLSDYPELQPKPAETGRKIQHSQFGEVTEASDQSGVGKGRLRVLDGEGNPHVIRNPRIAGNREAAFIKSTGAIPDEAMPELRAPNAPPPPLAGKPSPAGQGISYAIPDEAMPELRDRPRSKGTIMGSGFGALQGLFERGGKPKAPKENPTKADVESAGLGKALGNLSKGAGNEMRTLMTAIDFGAVGAQGFWLSASNPFKAIRSGGKMFRSLSRAQSDAIDAEIAFHPLRRLWEKADMYTATGARLKGDKAGGEEAYRGYLSQAPVIRGFERAYRTYLDTLRVSVFESYAKALERQGITFENNPKAYKDVAAFIDIATGRGQLKKGGTLEKASDLMGAVAFAPRNLISNFQILDPVRYAKMEPAARKIALKDSLTTLGAMIGTAALLRQAGVSVGFNPLEDDFMIARFGNTRYDLTFGKKTAVQFLARSVAGAYRQATGEGNLPGKDPLSVAGRFAEGKASPLISTALTLGRGRTYEGKKLADMSAGEAAWETAPVPILMKDLVDAYRQEGKTGLLKTSPAILGARVSTYPDRAKAAFIDTPGELRTEQKQFGQTRSFLTPRKDETPQQFSARKAQADKWTTDYGRQLTGFPHYKAAEPVIREAALEYLKKTIADQSGEKRPHLYLLRPSHVLAVVRKSAREAERKKRREAAQ